VISKSDAETVPVTPVCGPWDRVHGYCISGNERDNILEYKKALKTRAAK